MTGFVAVVVPDGSSVSQPVREVGPGMFAVVASEAAPDMLHYGEMAAAAADAAGRAALVACVPEDEYRLCLVFRRGRSPYSFSTAGAGTVEGHFAGLRQSYVTNPVAEGLSLAGFDPGLSPRLCRELGQHSHQE